MAATVSQLVDMRCVLGITAASKGQRSDGTIFVNVQLDVASSSSSASQQEDGSAATETVVLELTIPQFYNMLSEFEEAKMALRTADH